MATIAFTNTLAINPALEEVLDPTSPAGTANATTFDITNNEGGATDGFIFRLTGTGFTFAGPGGAPDGGTVTGFTVLDNTANIVATATPGTNGFGDDSLAHFWSNLTTLLPLIALNVLLDQSDIITGADGVDHLRNYTNFSPNLDILIGGTGDDILTGAVFVEVHGGAQDGTGGETENDVLQCDGFPVISAITDIDTLRFIDHLSAGVGFLTDQIGTGLLSPTLAVEALSPAHAIEIFIGRGGSSAVNLDLSNWTFNLDWVEGSNHITQISLADDFDDHVVGTSARDLIFGGNGNDTLDGFGGTDVVSGGNGDDRLISGVNAVFSTLNGGAGIDTAVVDRSNRTASYTFDLNGSGMFLDGSHSGIERIEFYAGSGNDNLTGGALADVLIGNAGSDFLAGGGGNDDLQGGNGIDTLSGDAGNDALAGGAGNDNLDGGEGDDTLTGGAGIDTVDGGDGTDTAVFSGPRAAYTITPLGSTFQISGPDGLDFLTNVEFAKFDDVTIALTSGPNQPPTITSNGGGASASVSIGENTTAVTTVTATDPDAGTTPVYSIAGGADQTKFQINSATGALSFLAAPNFEAPTDSDHNNSYIVQVRASDGSLFDDQVVTVNVTNVNEARQSNDFNGDGRSDILWRHSSGQAVEWQMNGSQILANLGVAAPGNDWRFQDTGDFGGDGMSDVMWRHTTGQVVLWQMNGNQIVSNTAIQDVSNQYHVQGIGDFSGDGKSDVLFRHDSGQVVVWQMNGDKIASNTAIVDVSTQYHIEGVGDLGGDGKSDILLRHDNGQVVLWQMNGDKIAVNTAIATVSQEYHVQGIGDFNGDGMSDVLWRHDSGQFVLWQMNGDKIVSNTQILDVSNQYKVQDVRDYNGDGMSDILLRHDSGQVVLWQMNGDHIAANTAITTVGTDWTIQSHHFDLV